MSKKAQKPSAAVAVTEPLTAVVKPQIDATGKVKRPEVEDVHTTLEAAEAAQKTLHDAGHFGGSHLWQAEVNAVQYWVLGGSKRDALGKLWFKLDTTPIKQLDAKAKKPKADKLIEQMLALPEEERIKILRSFGIEPV